MLYLVSEGDTLDALAEQFGLTPVQLLRLNPGLRNLRDLPPGLIISVGKGERNGDDEDLHQYLRPHLPQADEPWPEGEVQGRNLGYAELLQEDYAGVVSEFTAINQYIYHHIDMEEKYESIADLEVKVSIVEMYHLEMLGEIIKELGGDPQYWDGRCRYWRADVVEYFPRDPVAQLEADIEAEKAAIAAYRAHMAMIRDPYIRSVLARIIRDEELHLRLFSEALADLEAGLLD